MAISEKLCWDVLKRIKGNSATFNKGQENSHAIDNAIPSYNLEKELVLHYTKSQIEDSLYFLEKRGYLAKHGYVNFTLVANQSGWLGVKFNLGELFRRYKKKRNEKQ